MEHASGDIKVCPVCKARFSGSARFCPQDGVRLQDVRRGTVQLLDPLVGSLLGGRYRVLVRVRDAGAAAYYGAEHVHLQRRVLLKVFDARLASRPELASAVLEQTHIEAQVDHPNVLKVLDSGLDEGPTLFVAMEYVDGRTLDRILDTEAPLAVPRALELAAQVCDGLEAAHRAGLVHGNLAPDVVLVHGEPESVKLYDFSGRLSRRDTRLTSTGFLEGQPEFMTPEHASGEPIGPWSDVYSAGILLYAMLVGRVPFSEKTFTETLWAHLRNPVPDPRIFKPDLPDSARRLLARALAKRREDRFPSAEAFGREIRAVAAELSDTPGGEEARALSEALRDGLPEPVIVATESRESGPASPPERPTWRSSVLRKPRLILVVAATAAGFLLGGLGMFLSKRHGRRQPGRGSPRPRPSSARAGRVDCCTDTALLQVDSEPPGATVSLDGRPLGVAPLRTRLPCSSRPILLEVSKPGYQPRRLRAKLCRSTSLVVGLRPKTEPQAARSPPGRRGRAGRSSPGSGTGRTAARARAGSGRRGPVQVGVFKVPEEFQ